jgi:hypothetical protein
MLHALPSAHSLTWQCALGSVHLGVHVAFIFEKYFPLRHIGYLIMLVEMC